MLQKPNVETENILKLANFIENFPHKPGLRCLDSIQILEGREANPPKNFSMSTVYGKTECGTVGCLVGYCAYLFPKERLEKVLGISALQGHCLCMPQGYSNASFDPTPKEAAKVLRHLAVTGEVDWTIVGGPKNILC